MDLIDSTTLDFLVQRTRYVTGATGAALALIEAKDLICRARSGETAPPLGMRLRSNTHSLTGQALRTGQLLRCNTIETDDRVDVDGCRQLDIESIQVLPLRRDGHIVGVFELFSNQPYAFEERDTDALKRMGLLMEKALAGELKWGDKNSVPNDANLYPVKKKRRSPRFDIGVPLRVNTLRSGVPDTLPGRSINMGQGGLAAVLTSELSPGDVVILEFSLPLVTAPMKLRAQVRSQHRLHHGFEFLIPRLEGPERAG
jgi:GAF domain/PilZ domain